MNDQNPLGTVPRHPLFRAMVLMGNGIAVGCGGTTVTGQSGVGDGTGGRGGSGGPGTAGSGGLTGASGSGFLAAGGAVLFGGNGGAPVIIRGTGGTEPIAFGGATNDPPPLQLPCTPPQYDCQSDNAWCGPGTGWSFGAVCTCNPKRPRSPSDCATGESFVCLDGKATAGGRPLVTSVPFECSCVPGPISSCGVACDTAFQGLSGGRFACSDMSAVSILCGCAAVVLR